MSVRAWLGSPFIAGAAIGAVFARGEWSRTTAAALGVAVGFGIVLWAYYSAPPSGAPYDGCSDCENYLGRWLEPTSVILIVAIGYVFWLFGIGAGVWVRRLVRRTRETVETSS